MEQSISASHGMIKIYVPFRCNSRSICAVPQMKGNNQIYRRIKWCVSQRVYAVFVTYRPNDICRSSDPRKNVVSIRDLLAMRILIMLVTYHIDNVDERHGECW